MWLKDCNVHVIGLGLMGGSMAMALRGKVARLTGSDIDPETQSKALDDDVIQGFDGLGDAGLVILAIPPEAIMASLPSLELRPDAVIIDLGSTKKAICDVMDTLSDEYQPVGGHPMCGLAENGYRNAIPTLYAGARFILCETRQTGDHARQLVEQLLASLGAIPIWMDRQAHDHVAAVVSHLPHLMSFALMRLAMNLAENDDNIYELASGGFDGATRLARTNDAMIMGMFRTNTGQLRELTDLLHRHLDELITLLDNPDDLEREIRDIVAARRDYTRRYGERMIT